MASLDTPYLFHCLTGISEEHRVLVAKHGTLNRDAISNKLNEKKTMTTDQIFQLIDQVVHRAIKNALLKEEQSKRPTVTAHLSAARQKAAE